MPDRLSVSLPPLLLATLSLVWMTGCTGTPGAGTNATPSGDPVPLEQFADEMARVRCDKVYDCCSATEIDASQEFFFDDRDDCLETFRATIGTFFVPEMEKAIEAGRADYDAVAAGECITRFEAYDCDEFQAQFDGDDFSRILCDEMTVPKVDQGGLCTWQFECTTGSCVSADVVNEDPTCQTLPGVGEPCFERETASTVSKDLCAGDLECVDSTCVQPGEPGAECSVDDECITEDCTLGTCAEFLPVGERCFFDKDCASENCDRDERCGEPLDGACTLL